VVGFRGRFCVVRCAECCVGLLTVVIAFIFLELIPQGVCFSLL
jgi:hypothetical protein